VKAVMELLRSSITVKGLAHITGDGVLNLKRLNPRVGFEIDEPLDVPPICAYLCEQGGIAPQQAYQVFNMGCGFVAVVKQSDAAKAASLLADHHAGTRVIGHVTDRSGSVSLPGLRVTL
jgi:phosphoribosylformylglycinamidine cyclo-ligase